MKVRRPVENLLVVTSSSNMLAGMFLACFVLLGILAVVMVIRDPGSRATERFGGTVAASIVGLLGFAAMFETSEFTFDRGKREVRWHD